jgi:1-acyl-sn-glycerol-3-phosphate acyltransferase
MKKFLWLLYQPYKWCIFIPILGFSTLILGTVAIILMNFMKPKTVSFLCGVTWAKINSYLTPVFVKVIGRENINKKKSYVIVSNHQSQYDILVIYGWLLQDIKWVMKKELRKIPVFGKACEKLEHIYIDRSDHASAVESLENAKKKIINGTSAMFFPEGTRSRDGSLLPFKKGAFKMAIDLGVPMLPITITGTKNVLPAKTLNLFPGRVKMIIHKPVEIWDYNDENKTDLMEKVKNIITSGLEK